MRSSPDPTVPRNSTPLRALNCVPFPTARHRTGGPRQVEITCQESRITLPWRTSAARVLLGDGREDARPSGPPAGGEGRGSAARRAHGRRVPPAGCPCGRGRPGAPARAATAGRRAVALVDRLATTGAATGPGGFPRKESRDRSRFKLAREPEQLVKAAVNAPLQSFSFEAPLQSFSFEGLRLLVLRRIEQPHNLRNDRQADARRDGGSCHNGASRHYRSRGSDVRRLPRGVPECSDR